MLSSRHTFVTCRPSTCFNIVTVWLSVNLLLRIVDPLGASFRGVIGERINKYGIQILSATTVVDRKQFQFYITPWRAAISPLEKAGLSASQPLHGEIVMYNYPVLECLVAFAIVFLIGYLVADGGGKKGGNETTHI